MPSSNIVSLAIVLNKTLLSPTAESVLSSHHYAEELYMNSYSTKKNNLITVDTDHSENWLSSWKLSIQDWVVFRGYSDKFDR